MLCFFWNLRAFEALLSYSVIGVWLFAPLTNFFCFLPYEKVYVVVRTRRFKISITFIYSTTVNSSCKNDSSIPFSRVSYMAGLKANYTQSFYFSTETFKIGLAFKAINHAHDIGDTAENIPGLQKCLADKGQEDFVGITWLSEGMEWGSVATNRPLRENYRKLTAYKGISQGLMWDQVNLPWQKQNLNNLPPPTLRVISFGNSQ